MINKQTISAIIIAKNACNDIADCIASVSFCDKIIVVDNMSTDDTVVIAKKHGATVISHRSTDFSEQRNIGLHAAKTDWVFYIDVDERMTSKLKSEIAAVLSNRHALQAYCIKRKNFYLGKHPWPYIETLERLFKRSALKYWRGKLHETAHVDGNIGDLSGHLKHYTHKDLTSMLNKTITWSETEANLRHAAKHPNMTWWRFPRVMITAFWDSYIRQSGWKAGTAGLIESIYQAFSIFVTYARLWEMQQAPYEKTKH